MTPRDRKIRRIAAVQARLHRIAEWRLMECQAKGNELDDRRRRIIERFNDAGGLDAALAMAADGHLKSIGVEQSAVDRSRERLSVQARDEARKLKQVLRKVRSAAGRAAREDDQRVLEAEIERLVARFAGEI
ncbi:hypothetical protein ACTZWT_17745 [Rhodopseudomonas sp. NSM]|uniref:hypothetical protein n=1 Tax=Rhodopseudomonas sp. NSM TaxID=3457630 RepID=UPI0040350EE9